MTGPWTKSTFSVSHPCARPPQRRGPVAGDPGEAQGWGTGLLVCLIAIAALGTGAESLRAQLVRTPEPPAADWRQTSLEEYRSHLQELETLTAGCAKGRNATACDPKLVGPDDSVPWGAKDQPRQVRFGWLRVLFLRAQKPDEKPKEPSAMEKATKPDDDEDDDDKVLPDAPTTSQLLTDAQKRLSGDLAETLAGAANQSAYPRERAVLQQVLNEREFQRLKQVDKGPTLLEKFGNWINKLFESLGKLQVHAAWIGRVLFYGFLLAVAVGLGWALLQMERRWRIRLVPDNEGPAPTAPSARDWQLWLKDARESAARREWREAIHFLYWAAISRLESKKLWPADRARTPREYLALVAGDDPRKAGLGALTREFEWTWYGGRAAEETHYLQAEELAQGLFDGAER